MLLIHVLNVIMWLLKISSLKRHIESMHVGVACPCDHCKYSATLKSSLKRHMESMHGNVTYPCDQCDHKQYATIVFLDAPLVKRQRSLSIVSFLA